MYVLYIKDLIKSTEKILIETRSKSNNRESWLQNISEQRSIVGPT